MTDSKSACACACHGMSLGLDGWQDCSLCCAKPAPAPPEERCRRCGEAPDAPIHQPAVMRESGCCEYYSPAPTPPAARKAALTRDLVVRMVNAAMFGWPDTNEPAKLLAHDAALRARAEALERDLAETGKESARYFDAYNDEVTRCQAFEARASRLEELLREAGIDKALAGEE